MIVIGNTATGASIAGPNCLWRQARRALAAAIGFCLLASANHATAQDQWQVTLTPYLWLRGSSGDFTVALGLNLNIGELS